MEAWLSKNHTGYIVQSQSVIRCFKNFKMQISSESWASGKFQDYCAAMCTLGAGGRRENNKSGLLHSNILLFLTGETEWGPLWILGAIQLDGEVAMGARTTECIKSIFGRKLEFSKSGGE